MRPLGDIVRECWLLLRPRSNPSTSLPAHIISRVQCLFISFFYPTRPPLLTRTTAHKYADILFFRTRILR